MGFQTQIREALLELETAGLLRKPLRVSSAQGPEIEIDGHRVLCLCSNNYLGLANHPKIVAASRASAREEGVGAGASRLITGTMSAHREAEISRAWQDRRLPPQCDKLRRKIGFRLGTGPALPPGSMVVILPTGKPTDVLCRR